MKSIRFHAARVVFSGYIPIYCIFAPDKFGKVSSLAQIGSR